MVTIIYYLIWMQDEGADEVKEAPKPEEREQ